jgi:hypothetical protein
MKHVLYLMTLLILPLLVTACAGEGGDVPGAPQGPALIMFYTDD